MKNHLLKKRITRLSGMQAFILITIGMFSFSTTYAQIIYTDVNPDLIFRCPNSTGSSTYNFDLNNDGIVDFEIFATTNPLRGGGSSCNVYSVTIDPLGPEIVDGSTIPWYGSYTNGAARLYEDESIDQNSFWNPLGAVLGASESYRDSYFHRCYFLGIYGPWDFNDGYLALKLNIGNHAYYGWARLDVYLTEYTGSFTIKDYAYNSIPDSPILAGDKGNVATGISPPENQKYFSVFQSPASCKIIFSFSSAEQGTLQITNLMGQIVFAEMINSVSEGIDVSRFPKGMYLVTIKTSEQNFDSKFLKQ